MLLQIWLFLTTIAIILTGVTLLTRTDVIALIFGTLSFILWLLVGYGALDLTRITNNGDKIDHSEPSLAVIAGGMALLPILLVMAAALVSAIRE